MKRFRILPQDFDTRPYLLTLPIDEGWEDEVKEMHHTNKEQILNELKLEYGEHLFEQKEKDFIALGTAPFSILAFHNQFLRQARSAFVIGSYYPALTGVCALGERILNHLILKLRDYFKSSESYKKIYQKDSFDKWDLAISVLSEWKILLPEAETTFRKLSQLRNRSIHFNLDTEIHYRKDALEAIQLLQKIIEIQFTSHDNPEWFIQDTLGETYLKKSVEQNPFIKEVYIPRAELVGPNHEVVSVSPWVINDIEYDDKEITDEEFVTLRQKAHPR